MQRRAVLPDAAGPGEARKAAERHLKAGENPLKTFCDILSINFFAEIAILCISGECEGGRTGETERDAESHKKDI